MSAHSLAGLGGDLMDFKTLTLDQIWSYVREKANEHPKLLENMNTIYKIDLTNIENGTYYLTFSDGKLVIKSEEPATVDCTLSIKKNHFISLLEGKLNSTTAFMTGRLKVKGNIGLALKLEQLFKEIRN